LPTVRKSEYLNTLGQKLHPDIDVMWTGDKVIPEVITKESIKELGEVLQRKPVIWDNIHANDYDQRRVFLGGYHGRPVELYPYLNGILTNPNCEFEANFIAIHTLGTWCRIANSVQDSSSFDVQMVDLSDEVCVTPPETPVVPDVPEVDCEMSDELLPSLTAADVTSLIASYNYSEALKLALEEWLIEFNLNKKAPLKSYSKRNLKTQVINGQSVLTAKSYDLDVIGTAKETIETMKEDKSKSMALSHENLQLLTEMFCLPYEHGTKGNQLLSDFEWLLENVSDIYEEPPSKEKVSKWFEKLLQCDEKSQEVYNLFTNFSKIPNEAILYDLYPYIWDVKEVVSALESYVHWLSDSIACNLSIDTIKRSHNGLNIAINKLPIMNEFVEPWHIRYIGGLTGALHRMLPFQGGYIYLGQAPDIPTSAVLKTRSYSPSDKDSLYRFNRGVVDKSEVPMETTEDDIAFDYDIGVFSSFNSKTLFLIEDDEKELCGYVAAVSDNKQFVDHITDKWLPEVNTKYSETKTDRKLPHVDKPDEWKAPNSSHFILKLDSKVYEECVLKRVINTVLSVLKTSGATTVYHKLDGVTNQDFFLELGFFPVQGDEKMFWRSL